MEDMGITTLMVAAQFLEVGLNTLIKAATTQGMSDYVFIVYSNAMALCFLLPSSFLYYRNRPSPSITTSIIGRIFLLSLLSCTVQTLLYTGIGYSSPVLASAMVDLTPAFTFILAIVFRYEKMEVRQLSSHAKCIGTVVSIIGALMVTLYKGEADRSGLNLADKAIGQSSVSQEWLLGGILLAVGSFSLSLVNIVKTWIMKEYSAVLMTATISCGYVVVLSTMVALTAERNNAQAWVLRPNMELASILYSAIVVASMRSIVHIWACGKKGPLYVAMFAPLGMVIALPMGVVFLGETLRLGSVFGSGVIAIGFYGVMWGQAQEEKMAMERKVICSFMSSSSSSAKPLLQN